MFIEFQVGNFRSFRDIQKLSLQASPIRPNDSGLEEDNVFKAQGLRFLKSKGIYGGNASGKSNLAKAIGAFSRMVDKSVSEEDLTKLIWDDRFKLITKWDAQPIFFQYSFISNRTIYRYGFQILKEKVSYEWLFGTVNNEELQYFMRSPDGLKIDEKLFKGSGVFMDQIKKGGNELFRADSLFLTAAALNGNKLATNLRNSIRSLMVVDGINDKAARIFAIRILEEGTKDEKESLKKLLTVADTGIDDLEILEIEEVLGKDRSSDETSESSSENKQLKGLFSIHGVFDENGTLREKISAPFGKWESQGTSKLFGIGSLVLESLHTGRTLIIDEFDARFHPNLTLSILQLFHSKTTNPKNAQIIFVTHDSSLLRRAKLRRDQICFINKDKYGISSIKTLIQYKGVRKDASYEKEYLNGNYSAIPYLSKIDSAIVKNNNK